MFQKDTTKITSKTENLNRLLIKLGIYFPQRKPRPRWLHWLFIIKKKKKTVNTISSHYPKRQKSRILSNTLRQVLPKPETSPKNLTTDIYSRKVQKNKKKKKIPQKSR